MMALMPCTAEIMILDMMCLKALHGDFPSLSADSMESL